jgi:hypothetical protein
MTNGASSNPELRGAFEELIDGNSTSFSALLSESPIAFATIMVAFLGVLIRARFGAAVARSDLAKYANETHRVHEADDCPSLLVIESALRAADGEVSVLEQSQSEIFYEAVGLLVRSLLNEMDLTDGSKSLLLGEADEIIREALLAAS